MNIVFCIDKNYESLAKLSIESYRQCNPTAKIIVVSEYATNLGDDNRVIKLDREFRKRRENDRITNAAYLKLFLTELPYDKILFVDADTICQHPLDELWNIPCPYINLCESYSFGRQQANAVGHDRWGLTGMMMMNLRNLRRYKFTEKCLKVESEYPTPTTGWFHDETCINVAMWDKLKFIDRKFNYCHNREYDDPIPEEDAYILHYVGKDKSDMINRYKYGVLREVGDCIEGKRVAIVGNAQSLFGKNQGKEIDSYDFVIRFNKGFLYQPRHQGTKTSLLMLACNLTPEEIGGYHSQFVVNRSNSWHNPCPTLSNNERMALKEMLGSQPSTGFMAIDICIHFKARSIDLYGFDWEATPTFYNPHNYKTQHDYNKEQEIVAKYANEGVVTIH